MQLLPTMFSSAVAKQHCEIAEMQLCFTDTLLRRGLPRFLQRADYCSAAFLLVVQCVVLPVRQQPSSNWTEVTTPH